MYTVDATCTIVLTLRIYKHRKCTNTEDVQTLRMYNHILRIYKFNACNKDEQIQILGEYTVCGCTNTVDVQKLWMFKNSVCSNTLNV